MRNPLVDKYLIDGCMRCDLGATPACKVLRWTAELKELRDIVLHCGLVEELKWGVPCYTYDKANVVIVSALKESCCISFFKGALLKDSQSILVKPGENSQAGRIVKFRSLEDIYSIKETLEAYVFEAIEIEKAGLKVVNDRTPEPIPEELQGRFDEDPVFRTAFESLTKGRQRGYLLYFSQAKQTKTRLARIEKWTDRILKGEGMHDQYKSQKK